MEERVKTSQHDEEEGKMTHGVEVETISLSSAGLAMGKQEPTGSVTVTMR